MNDEYKQFRDFDEKKILSSFHEIFIAKQWFKIYKQSPLSPPKIVQDLKSYPYEAKFMKA